MKRNTTKRLMAVAMVMLMMLTSVCVIGETEDSDADSSTYYRYEINYSGQTISSVKIYSSPSDTTGVTATNATGSNAGSWGFDSKGEYGPFNSFYAAVDTTTGQIAYHLYAGDLTKIVSGNSIANYPTLDNSSKRYNIFWVIPTVYVTATSSKLTLCSDSSSGGTAYAHTIGSHSGPYKYLGIAVYEAYNDSGTLKSVSGVEPTTSKLRATFRTQATANYDNSDSLGVYNQWNFFQWTLYKMCAYTVMGNKDSQAQIGYGNVDNSKMNTGTMNSQGPYYGTTDNKTTGSKVFIENSWGGVSEFVDDVLFNNARIYAGQRASIDDTQSSMNAITDTYYLTGSSRSKYVFGYTNSIYTDAIVWDLPKGSTSYVSATAPDYVGANSGTKLICVGGGWDTEAGVASASPISIESSSDSVGARLAYVFDADPTLPPTTTVTISSNDAGYGSVSQVSVANVEVGSSITVSGSSITVGGTTVTATPTTDTAQYDYGFSGWSVSNGAEVTENMIITANFSRSVNNYTVTFVASPSDYGTVSPASLTVPYGTPLMISGAVLSAGSSSATAAPTTATSQYNYDFSGWSVSNNTQVTGDMTVTASFIRTSGTGSDSAPYGITIRAGDSFSYTPMTNLADTTIKASWSSALSGTYSEFTTTGGPGNLTWSNGVLSGSFPSTGTYYVKLDAEWGVGEGADRVTQSAEQYIMFEVVPVMTLGSDVSAAYSLSVIPNDRAIATIAPTPRMDSSSTIVWTMTQASGGVPLATDQFELSSVSGGSTVLKFKTATPAEGTYTVTVTATETYDSHSRLIFSDTVVYSISVGAATTAAPVVITTCIDDSQTSNYSGKTTSWTNGTGATWTVTAISGPKDASDTTQADTAPGLSVDDTTLNEPEWSVDVSSANANTNYGFSDSPSQTEDVYTKTVKYLATGYNTISSTATPAYDVDVSVTYNVYAKLAFIGAPSMSGLTGYSNPVNPMDVLMSVNIEAAKKVVFNWGDGKSNTLDVSMYDSNVSMAHVYERTGMYTVTVIAYNEFGNCSSTYLYSADSDMIMQAEKTFQVKDVKAVTNEDANTLTLTPIVVTAVGSGTALAYEWSYTMGEAKNVKITADNVSTLDFVINEGVPGASIILDTAKLGENAKFTVKVTATFADGDEASKAISYNYSAEPVDIVKDYGMTIVFILLFTICCLAIYPCGFRTYWMYALLVIFAVLAVLMCVYHDFNGLIDAVKDLLRIE